VHEQRLRLVQLQQRLRGEFEDLVVPARSLLREAGVQEVARKANKAGRMNAAQESADTTEVAGKQHSLKGAGGAMHHYAFLCNDSLWFCEVLRGNKYKVVHTFLFKPSDAPAATAQKALSAQDAKASLPTTDVQQSGPSSFWVSDGTLSVHLRLASGEDADPWVQSIEDATSASEKSVGDDMAPVAATAAEGATPAQTAASGMQPASQASAPLTDDSSSVSTATTATPLPPNVPKPSARYITQYRARHNLGPRPSAAAAESPQSYDVEKPPTLEAVSSAVSVSVGVHGGAKF